MEAYKANKLPFDYDLSKELIKLLCDAREIYGEYKGYLKSMEFDYKYLLENLMVSDIYYSFKMDNVKIEKGDMFYMPYSIKNNDSIIFNNLKKAFYYGIAKTNKTKFDIDLLDKMHKIIYIGCKKNNLIKGSGHFRKKQTYLLKPGIAGSSISFVPPVYNEVNPLMKNLCAYCNSAEDENFITLALTHFQFERIHPYSTGNGKLGRILIPILFSNYKSEPPILFLSQSIENLKNTYFTLLSTVSEKEIELFVKFFLQCVIDECTMNIKKIKKLNKIYLNDSKSFKKEIGGSTIFKIYPLIIKKIVFTTSDIVEESKLHINSVNKVLNKLVDTGYLIKEKKNGTNRVTFKYKNMYEVFVN